MLKKGTQSKHDLQILARLAPLEHQVEEAFFERTDEEAFWWAFYERHDALKKAQRKWVSEHKSDLATRETRLAALQEQVNNMAGFGPQRESMHKPLIRWYHCASVTQRKSWARGDGPNLPPPPGMKQETLERIRRARDDLLHKYGIAPQKSIAAKAHVARSTVQRYLLYLK